MSCGKESLLLSRRAGCRSMGGMTENSWPLPNARDRIICCW